MTRFEKLSESLNLEDETLLNGTERQEEEARFFFYRRGNYNIREEGKYRIEEKLQKKMSGKR